MHPNITDATLEEVDAAARVFWGHVNDVVVPPTTIKFHNLMHHGGAAVQRWLGELKNLDSQHFEGAHRELIQGYK